MPVASNFLKQQICGGGKLTKQKTHDCIEDYNLYFFKSTSHNDESFNTRLEVSHRNNLIVLNDKYFLVKRWIEQ